MEVKMPRYFIRIPMKVEHGDAPGPTVATGHLTLGIDADNSIDAAKKLQRALQKALDEGPLRQTMEALEETKQAELRQATDALREWLLHENPGFDCVEELWTVVGAVDKLLGRA